MENLLMKRIYLALMVVLAFSSLTFAQNNAATGVTVNATVIQGLTLTVANTLGFGTIVAGTTPAAISANTGSGIPLYTATGNGGKVLTSVTYPATVSLTGPGTALTFTPSLVGASLSTSQATATAVTSGSSVTLSGTTGSPGYYYFWLGGSLAALPAGQTPGAYTGTFTLTVSY